MSLIACPHGCGTHYDTATDFYCPGCRYASNEARIEGIGWCWAWFGPPSHRMKCRRPSEHTGEHHEHEDSDPDFNITKYFGTKRGAQ